MLCWSNALSYSEKNQSSDEKGFRKWVKIIFSLLNALHIYFEEVQIFMLLSFRRIKYYINGGLVSVLMYNTQLHSLKVHVNTKTLIFYDSYFHDAISGCPEDLGNIITTVLGLAFSLRLIKSLVAIKNVLRKNLNNLNNNFTKL